MPTDRFSSDTGDPDCISRGTFITVTCLSAVSYDKWARSSTFGYILHHTQPSFLPSVFIGAADQTVPLCVPCRAAAVGFINMLLHELQLEQY